MVLLPATSSSLPAADAARCGSHLAAYLALLHAHRRRAPAQNQGPLEHVPHLAHVAGPGVGQRLGDRLDHERLGQARHADQQGILSIQSYARDAYDQTGLAMLQELADHCGGAIERLRIENELRQSRDQLARTEAFALVMTAHVSLDGRSRQVPPSLCAPLGGTAE